MSDKTDQLLHLDPYEFPTAYYFNALAHLELKEYDAAEKSAQQAVQADWKQSNPKTHYLLGAILVQKQNWTGAAESFRAYSEGRAECDRQSAGGKNSGPDRSTDQPACKRLLRIPPRNK